MAMTGLGARNESDRRFHLPERSAINQPRRSPVALHQIERNTPTAVTTCATWHKSVSETASSMIPDLIQKGSLARATGESSGVSLTCSVRGNASAEGCPVPSVQDVAGPH